MFQKAEKPVSLCGTAAAQAFLAPSVASQTSDRLWVAHVDGQARCIGLSSYVHSPTITEAPLGEIIREAALLGSAGLILASSHLDGSPEITSAQVRATRQLAISAEALEVAVVDHLVFTGANCRSMRRTGLL